MDNNKLNKKLFNKVQTGLCRLATNGEIAVKTSSGYKLYDADTGSLISCTDFVFNANEDFFFAVPTNKVTVGDVILISGKPCCVIAGATGISAASVKVINYEDFTIESIIPHIHTFMGSPYHYVKVVSMFGDDLPNNKKGLKNLTSYMIMLNMLKDFKSSDSLNSHVPSMLPFFIMQNEGLIDALNFNN